ncbi:hypothetical protein KKA01_01010, partial [Patescibacteria group bacterium]|nr:hypothetical protein [Patescibacteria group bacterium]
MSICTIKISLTDIPIMVLWTRATVTAIFLALIVVHYPVIKWDKYSNYRKDSRISKLLYANSFLTKFM